MPSLPPGTGFTLLYVEDEEITRQTVLTLLGRRFPGLAIHGATNGAEGVELFRKLSPDLVVTDIKMPVLSGIDMARQLMELKPSLPVIVTSAHSEMQYLIESIELGISRYVLKPIDSAKLFTAVDGCLNTLSLERERVRNEREIELLNRTLSARAEELEVANRDLEGFSYTVSHDLRTPLTNINGYCQVILELYGASLDEGCKEFVNIILNETINMNQLIKTLLEFSKVTRSELTRSQVNLSELATLIAAGQQLAAPGRRLVFTIEPDITTHGDPALLKVVLENLISNACKYSGKRDESRIEFRKTEREGEAVYLVRDNGAGFDMEQADKLFTPFRRLHSDTEFKGFGVGLATVQRIVQRHGGRVWAEGEVDKGASFYFTLSRPQAL